MEVRADFFAAFSGDMKRFERGMARCEEELAKDPNHAEAMVHATEKALAEQRAQYTALLQTLGQASFEEIERELDEREPVDLDSGLTPYDLLLAGLGEELRAVRAGGGGQVPARGAHASAGPAETGTL